ncbi:hypothetical protein FGG08_006523 [Glutinoglossum americanum]|uniref:Uncharacterized protein n=1 Tax=Glutinoglossum americanum TaxID=1670608 RepID=A0A9P8I1C3_9PEZI|nr:hypothetical protein FGG08_006523 [Glutinoglossum americanum]
MGLFPWQRVLALIGATFVIALPDSYDSHWSAKDIIIRDVCVIGGGSSGTYAAIRLRDMNQSVVVVERKDRLGGHTETYTDPGTQAKLDIGVRIFHNTDLVKNYFARFNVPLITADLQAPGESKYVDLRTGAVVTNFSPGDPTAALGAYAGELAKYPYLDAGFDLPDPVPADLLLPFSDFATKHRLEAGVGLIFRFGEGIGDMLRLPTLYAMKLVGLRVLQSIQTGFLTTARHDNSELYEKAQAVLGADNALLLNSHIISTQRDTNDGYVRVVVATPSGQKLIKAKKILLTIPTTLDSLDHFDLDGSERSVFKQFNPNGFYTGILRNTGIPDNTTIINTGVDTPFNVPFLPGVYSIDPTGVPGLHGVIYGSPNLIPGERVKDDIIAAIQRLRTAGTLPTTKPEFAVFSSHSPFMLTVPSNAIAGGFYRQLYALQGHRHTFYTGANFHTHDSSMLWQFTEALLPRIVA